MLNSSLDVARVFVLGAGVSYGAGFPLASELFVRVYECMAPEDQKALDRALTYLYPLARSPHPPSRALTKVNIEEFMSLLDMAEEFNEILPTTFLSPKAIRSLRHKLLGSIVDLLVDKQQQAEADRNKIGYIDSFISKLSNCDTVITFNWDILIDRRLRKLGILFHQCPRNGSTDLLTLLKLHGSLDWYRGAELDSRRGFEVLHRQLFRAGWSELTKLRTTLPDEVSPFMVPPSFFKTLRGCADVEQIWAEAFGRLSTADEVYVCGYRFPPEDLFARFVFRRAIRFNVIRRGRKSAAPLKLVVVNPNSEVADFVRRSIYGRVRHEKARFEVSSLVG